MLFQAPPIDDRICVERIVDIDCPDSEQCNSRGECVDRSDAGRGSTKTSSPGVVFAVLAATMAVRRRRTS